MTAGTMQSLLPTIKTAGLTPRLHIDQVRLGFYSLWQVPARTAHTAIRKAIGDLAVYGFICRPEDEEERKKATYRSFSVALHDLTQDRKRNVPGISIPQLYTLCARLSPEPLSPVIEYSEIALDLYEQTPLASMERAEIALIMLLHCAKAVGMSKIRGARKKGEKPLTFENNDRAAVLKHLMAGYSIFIKDKYGRKLKVYIKTHDTRREFNPLTGKMEKVILGQLPTHLHRVRLEWSFTGDANPIKCIDDLQDLKPLAEWFYMNKLGTASEAIKPSRPGKRRKKPAGASSDTQFNRRIRDAARCFQLPKPRTEKGAVKNDLNVRSTEGKRATAAPQTLITSEASYDLSSVREQERYGLPKGVLEMIEGLTFGSASLSTPEQPSPAVAPGHHFSSSHSSPLTFAHRPARATHGTQTEHR